MANPAKLHLSAEDDPSG